ncbi:MAG TPA: SDR family NAD(P)-dependent oxidoreductase [Solirubrobacterales bacterium]|nr:SDR family NAD(P)-dependent oxidoreductase [Solirubrobacterales bacterium]
MEQLRGRNALVTGAGGGLGAYIARALAGEGVNLAVTDLPGSSVDGLSAELRTRGVQVEHAPADLTDRDERRRLASWAADALGPIDILVNNAGVEFGGPFLDTSPEQLELTVAVNLLAVMDLTRLLLPGMLDRRRGHVVSMASLAGKIPPPQLASYGATKHGVVGFTGALRAELADERVGFSAICPGFVGRVGMFGRLEPYIEGGSVPMGTIPPERVGDAVVRAIREDVGEIVLNRRPVKPLILLNAIAPGAASRLARLRPIRESMERMRKARERYDAAQSSPGD